MSERRNSYNNDSRPPDKVLHFICNIQNLFVVLHHRKRSESVTLNVTSIKNSL